MRARPPGATTYAYSSEGNRGATTPASGTSYTYSYDEANDLTKVTPSAGSSTSYVYDGNGLLQSETTGSQTTNYTWNVDGSLPLLLQDATNYYVYGPLGTTPIEQVNISSGQTSYLLTDQLGSVRAITNAAGTVTGTFTYDAWGNLAGSSGSATTPFGFAGAYLDSSNGLYYLRARWYDASTGEFMSLDPKVASTLQPYQYVANDPVNGTDPSGDIICVADACRKIEKSARVMATAIALTAAAHGGTPGQPAPSSNGNKPVATAGVPGPATREEPPKRGEGGDEAQPGETVNESKVTRDIPTVDHLPPVLRLTEGYTPAPDFGFGGYTPAPDFGFGGYTPAPDFGFAGYTPAPDFGFVGLLFP